MNRCKWVIHRFDKTTHQCECGRWQPGFAPKKTPSKPTDECQVCAGMWAITADKKLGHHGYKRPGTGWIEGDCAGVGEKPFPETDALERWFSFVTSMRSNTQRTLSALPEITEITETFMEYNEKAQKRVPTPKTTKKPTTKEPAKDAAYVTGGWGEWRYAYRRRERELTQTIEQMTKELERVSARITKGKELRAKAGVA